MSTLLLNHEEFHLTPQDLPCMIHGTGKSGASFFTMNVVLDLIDQGHKVIFYSAFHMARDFLTENVAEEKYEVVESRDQLSSTKQLLIPLSGEKELFIDLLLEKRNSEYIIIVKNVEELSREMVREILKHKNVIVSGGCGDKKFSNLIVDHSYASRIFFSDLHEFLPNEKIELDTYEGYLEGRGTVTIHV